MSQNPIENILIKNLGFPPEKAHAILTQAKDAKDSLLCIIEAANLAPIESVLREFSKFFKVPVILRLRDKEIPKPILNLIPVDMAQELAILPIDRAGNNVFIATSDPRNLQIMDKIRFKTGYFPKPILASEVQIREALTAYYGQSLDMTKFKVTASDRDGKGPKKETERQREEIATISSDDGPIINLVNKALMECLRRGASDIHFEPYEEFTRIRLRIDGALHEIARPPNSMRDALISRMKIMAKLNIAEKRLPQDGAININIGGKPVDFRVSCLPTMYGEKIVLRILDKSNLQVDMTQLGFEKEQLAIFKRAIYAPFGIVLVTGPTGSGKTTTLYSGLAELNKEEHNIMTAEDPVEFNLPGVNQVHTKADIGLTFAAALKAFLRQDPDIIMVGEIRDLETAEIAVKASLTGHLVLSTLHTNSAADTISRLLNMGVEPFNLVAALNCITAQRLLRKICVKCKVEDTETKPEVLISLGIPKEWVAKVKLYKGAGCPTCNNTGLKGRIAVHEVLDVTEPIKESILRGESSLALKRTAIKHGLKTLRMSALTKMMQGLTTPEEVVAKTAPDAVQEDKAKKAS